MTIAQFKYCLWKEVVDILFDLGPNSASTAGLVLLL